jgi:DNA-binding NtrC family response regulator
MFVDQSAWAPATPTRSPKMQAFKLKVLVADDSKLIHDIFQEIASRSPIPFDIISAEDGQQCMDAPNRGGIHLAFIDVNMPEMSGMDAVGRVRLTGNKTFVTLMSANANQRRMQLAQQLNVYDFLAKPFTHDQVYAILKTYCRVAVPSNVLVVDDSATVRRIIKKVFANSIFNIDVTEAGDGETALSFCDSGEFDAVFLDCNMPGLPGTETLERLLERDPGVRVIMITGERDEQRRKWALDRGAFAFLYKPFNAADINRELQTPFGLRRPLLADIEPLKLARVVEEPMVPAHTYF